MTTDLQTFTEKLVQVYVKGGLPQSIAQVVVYLTVCEPPTQTARDIREHLSLSVGSVNMALNMLVGSGLVVRNKPAGDKRYFYELESAAWERSIWQRLRSLDDLTILAQQGITLMPDNQRVATMKDLYQYFGDEFRSLMNRFEEQKKAKI